MGVNMFQSCFSNMAMSWPIPTTNNDLTYACDDAQNHVLGMKLEYT